MPGNCDPEGGKQPAKKPGSRSYASGEGWLPAQARASTLAASRWSTAARSLADHDEQARAMLAALFKSGEELIAAGLRRMQAKGTLKPDANPDDLAISLMAAVQGGYLLANTAHDIRPMEISIDLALEQLKSYLAKP
jgi:Transcriptional regulator LmrA/YxaF-like, C-terminal domain